MNSGYGISDAHEFCLCVPRSIPIANVKAFGEVVEAIRIRQTSVGLDRMFLAVLSASLKKEELGDGS